MADREHLSRLQEGVAAWNRWRGQDPEVIPYLNGAVLRGADLSGANLRKANLTGANLPSAKLFRADLIEANLRRADLTRADLSGANLRRANLAEARLTRANLAGADIAGADLSRAHLARAQLRRANLYRASVHGAYLHQVDLQGAHLGEADLSGTRIGSTSLSDVDLSQARGLASVVHDMPSSVGVDTLARTLRGSGGRFTDEQVEFFVGAGVPPILLEYLPSLLQTEPLQFYKCFVSYSAQDEAFADRLNQDLNKSGIQTWKWNLDAVAGRDLRENIDRAIWSYDKMILVCSINSLTSGPVDREIETALQKEDRLKSAAAQVAKEALAARREPPYVDTDVLVPIRTDDTVFNWTSHLAPQVRRRYIPDFTAVMPNSDKYRAELQRLINALNPRTWPPGPPQGPS